MYDYEHAPQIVSYSLSDALSSYLIIVFSRLLFQLTRLRSQSSLLILTGTCVDGFLTHLWLIPRRFFSECDGVIHGTNKSFEGEALKKWQGWLGEKPSLAVGPVSPPASARDIHRERSKSPVGDEVETFLNTALDKFGLNSVVYVRSP